ncbi:hypothetical protein TrVE_jg11556 [Triparma verrucosa]|uniref:peptidylprolyl isomerase n=1 Tax=Triparma verrucosa TaxID=1606542 RepID=A0A9W7BN50_9STRA|nr:hypothetical protein TrVE_jg11556 [Triparma verrucosa]
MSHDHYKKWDKYDVEDEEVKVEERSKREERERKLEKLEDLQLNIESSTVDSHLADSESYESRNAVDGFRKVKKGRAARKGKGKKPDAGSVAGVVGAEEVKADDRVEKTTEVVQDKEKDKDNNNKGGVNKTLADNAKDRAEALKLAISQRNDGKREAKDGKYRKALETFTSGLVHLDNYEELLNTWEESNPSAPQDEDADKENEEQPKKKKRNSADVCCGPDAEKIKEQQQLLRPDPLRPEKDNLCITLRRDFNLNIGRSYLELGNVTDASEALKYVLLVDGGNISAWVARAECFRRMQLFTLADLHLVKATEIDDTDRNAKAVKKMNDKDIIIQKSQKILEDVDGGQDDPVKVMINSRQSAKDFLSQGVEMYKQGNVVFREQFFNTAGEKYQKAANYISAAEQVLMNCQLPDSINNIRVASCLQSAACDLLRKRNFRRAERFSSDAIKFGGFNVTALLRRAEARMELGKFDKAVKDLKACERSLQKKKQRTSNSEAALTDVRERIKRVEYIQSQITGHVKPNTN